MKKTAFLLILITLLVVTSCQKLDVIGNHSIESLANIMEISPELVTHDGSQTKWELNAPDDTACFIWSKHFTQNDQFDVMMEFNAMPFISAGLDIDKLPANFKYAPASSQLAVGMPLSIKPLQNKDEISPIDSYSHIVQNKRKIISYHASGDHYGIELGDGNIFMWAKDVNTNEKDIVFMLNPEPLRNAGADLTKIDGWTLTQVKMHEGRREVTVEKLVKAFNLKDSLLLREKSKQPPRNDKIVIDADLVINIADITENASFYSVQIDGVLMEILAVKAPDGTIRTAFNTCEVCHRSGKGFFEQSGTLLVCQNCGRRFRMNQVEKEAGGCNPVPIFPENKTVTDNTITIRKEFMSQYKELFILFRH